MGCKPMLGYFLAVCLAGSIPATAASDSKEVPRPNSPGCPRSPEGVVELATCARLATDDKKFEQATAWILKASGQLEGVPAESGLHAEVLNASVHFANAQENTTAAIDLYRGTIRRLRESLGPDHPAQIDALLMAAHVASTHELPHSAEAFHLEAIRIAELHRGGAAGKARVAESWSRFAQHLKDHDLTEQSAAYYRRVAGLYEWDPDADWLPAAVGLARIEAELGKAEAAGKSYSGAIEMLRRRLGGGSDLADVLLEELRQFGKQNRRPELVETAKKLGAELRREPATAPPLPDAAARHWRRIAGPLRIYMSRPEYPAPARQERASGRVDLDIVVLADGTAAGARVTDASPRGLGFEEAAIRAATNSLFLPALQDGVPVDTIFEISFTFDLR